MSKTIKPCPMCGESVEVERDGSSIEITCCVTMSREKLDYISEYFGRDDEDTNMYQDEVEDYVLDAFLKEWNTRDGSRPIKTNAKPISYIPKIKDISEGIEVKFRVEHQEFRDKAYTLAEDLVIFKDTDYQVSMDFNDFPRGQDLKECIDTYGKWLKRMGSALIEENKKGSFESIKV